MIAEAVGLSVRFKPRLRRRAVTALDGMDLAVQEGDYLALLGLNGAGKTTALHCFLGLLRPTSGAVRLMGHRPSAGSSLFREIGFLPEEPHYHDYLTVGQAIAYYGGLVGSVGWQEEAARLIERLGLGEYRTMRVRKCSKGIKQKLGIVQCLLGRPRLLFLDEPMRGLDPLAVRELRDLLIEANSNGATIVMSSHMLSEVEMVASRVAVLDHGRILAQGRLADVLGPSDDVYACEVQSCEAFPDYFAEGTRREATVEGLLPAARFHDFMDFVRGRQLKVLSCTLRRGRLEDAFLAVLKQGHA